MSKTWCHSAREQADRRPPQFQTNEAGMGAAGMGPSRHVKRHMKTRRSRTYGRTSRQSSTSGIPQEIRCSRSRRGRNWPGTSNGKLRVWSKRPSHSNYANHRAANRNGLSPVFDHKKKDHGQSHSRRARPESAAAQDEGGLSSLPGLATIRVLNLQRVGEVTRSCATRGIMSGSLPRPTGRRKGSLSSCPRTKNYPSLRGACGQGEVCRLRVGSGPGPRGIRIPLNSSRTRGGGGRDGGQSRRAHRSRA